MIPAHCTAPATQRWIDVERHRRSSRRRAIVVLFFLFAFAFCLASASAAPTEQDVFKSINENVGKPSDNSRLLPVLVAGAGLVLLVIFISQRINREPAPKKVASRPTKLMKEIAKGVGLRSAEMKQLKAMAQTQDANPLTLLLCPSIMVKAVQAKRGKVDRKIVVGMASRFRPPGPAGTPGAKGQKKE